METYTDKKMDGIIDAIEDALLKTAKTFQEADRPLTSDEMRDCVSMLSSVQRIKSVRYGQPSNEAYSF